jgi:peptide/nickel transport system ATP-binding protein
MHSSPSAGSAVLAIEGLSVALPRGADRRYAVEDISLTVRSREILCLVGESGSGKSVTAHSVMGLLPKGQLDVVAGRVLLEGEDLVQVSDTRLRDLRCTRMSMIFQEPMTALNPVMTCGAQIDEVLRTHTDLEGGARTERILAIMRDVRLPEPELVAHAYPHQVSGGQRQRICIARALAMEPELLIADEAVSALDVSVQAQVLRLFDDIRRRLDLAMLFITHDLRVAAQVCDTVAVMHRGRVVEYGPAAQVFVNPRDDYTKSLIAAAPGRDWDFGRFAT